MHAISLTSPRSRSQGLWNGNNWVVELSRCALRWAIAFWHEHTAVARDVLGMVNDILWLHYPHFYLTDGTPVEGLSYSYLSIEDTADLVVRSSTIPNPQDLLPSLT